MKERPVAATSSPGWSRSRTRRPIEHQEDEHQAAQHQEDEHQADDPILRRIAADAGVADLAGVLADRIPPSDLNSLWMGVSRRRAAKVTPARLLARYAADRYSRPSNVSPSTMSRLDVLAWSLLPEGWSALDLSPVAPLGTVSAIGPIDQNKVLSTGRPLEVVADSTNVLALEAALHRQALLRADPRSGERVRLASSHRLLRMQPFDPPATQHFRLFGMVDAGRDVGGLSFEIDATREQIDFYLRLLAGAAEIGIEVGEPTVVVLDLGNRRPLLEESFNGARVEAAPPDAYYTDIRFQIYAAGMMLVDGGSTAFTRRLLSNDKERIVTSGLGSERLCTLAAQPAAGSPQSSRQRPIESAT